MPKLIKHNIIGEQAWHVNGNVERKHTKNRPRVDAVSHGYLIHPWLAKVRFTKYDEIDDKKIKIQKEFYQVQWKNIKKDIKRVVVLPRLAPQLAYGLGLLLLAILKDFKLPFEIGAVGAIAVDTVTTGLGGSTGQTITISHTSTGSDRFLLAAWAGRSDGDDPTTGSITYDGSAMTDQTIQTNVNGWQCMKSKIAPATTAKNVVFTYSDVYALNQWDNGAVAGVISFTGVHQTTPTSNPTNATGTSTSPSVTITSAVGSLVFGACNPGQIAIADAITVGDTSQWNLTSTGAQLGRQAASTAVGAASVVMDYSIPNSNTWFCTGISIEPVAVANSAFLTFMGPQPQQ